MRQLLKLSSKCEDYIFIWFQTPRFVWHFLNLILLLKMLLLYTECVCFHYTLEIFLIGSRSFSVLAKLPFSKWNHMLNICKRFLNVSCDNVVFIADLFYTGRKLKTMAGPTRNSFVLFWWRLKRLTLIMVERTDERKVLFDWIVFGR